jgi:hypothetical protein
LGTLNDEIFGNKAASNAAFAETSSKPCAGKAPLPLVVFTYCLRAGRYVEGDGVSTDREPYPV